MVLTILAVMVALLQFVYFGIEVGRARGRYGIQAPAITGHPEFERYFRVHVNTLEQLAVVLPSSFAFAYLVSDLWAAVAVAVYIVGRFIYFRGYVADPAKRGLGFMLSALPGWILALGSIIAAVMALL
jgi:glutathione S-transferase